MLNLGDASVSFEEKKIELSKNEYKILQILMERAGKIVPRDEIITVLWESESFIDDNTLTVNVTRLRKRLEEVGLQGYIQTKKGIDTGSRSGWGGNGLKIFVEYINEKKRGILGTILMECVTILILWLNDIPISKVSYAVFLGIVVLLICMAGEFFQYFRKRKKLELLKKSVSTDLAFLPETDHALEMEYQTVILNFLSRKRSRNPLSI